MMLSDRTRLLRRASTSRYQALARAMKQFSSTLTVMNTGAHPDDEQSGLLAWFSLGEGARVIIACSTRGEGGQNALGPERGAALGLVRSRELEEAARAIDADVHWLGHGPLDPVHDFGFSKNGKDTLERWGRARVIDRLVRAYRLERPDVVIPTFLDVPGQHGHHRAMTEAAIEAVRLAGDPSYECEGLAPWGGIKFYLPAWTGGGDTYDDELPPPPATLVVRVKGREWPSGMSYDRLGEVSRAYHASQGMGHWRPEKLTSWGLHRLDGAASEAHFADGLPATMEQLAKLEGAPQSLAQVARDLADAVNLFPDEAAVSSALARAYKGLAEKGTAAFESAHGHRLARKRAEVIRALSLSGGLEVHAELEEDALTPGRSATVRVDIEEGCTKLLRLEIDAFEGVTLRETENTPDGQRLHISVAPDVSPASRYEPAFSSLGGNGILSLKARFAIGGIEAVLPVDLVLPALMRAPVTVQPSVDAVLINLAQDAKAQLSLTGSLPEGVSLLAPQGLRLTQKGPDVALEGSQLSAGRHTIGVQVHGAPAWQSQVISYDHIGALRFTTPAQVSVLALDLVVPQVRVGYVGGGADRAGVWLERMGADVVDLDATAFAAARESGFAGFDTIVVGIFSFGLRPDLAEATAALHDWVHKGGNLVTLYHRPWDNWLPNDTAPGRMVIGAPSLRWRVTKPDAPVTILQPEHDLLSGPNPISHADFEGWDKERGLYFLSAWDEAYQPLLAMADPEEQPLLGALVTGRFGAGRHTHSALVLHHQMDRLVPGAFRLMANLIGKP